MRVTITHDENVKAFKILKKIMPGFKYSKQIGRLNYSLDENLGRIYTVAVPEDGFGTPAHVIVDTMGANAFKAMIYYIMTKPIMSGAAINTPIAALSRVSVSRFMERTFDWSQTAEGSAYWSDVYHRLRSREL